MTSDPCLPSPRPLGVIISALGCSNGLGVVAEPCASAQTRKAEASLWDLVRTPLSRQKDEGGAWRICIPHQLPGAGEAAGLGWVGVGMLSVSQALGLMRICLLITRGSFLPLCTWKAQAPERAGNLPEVLEAGSWELGPGPGPVPPWKGG